MDEVTVALPEALVELVADRAAERLGARLPATPGTKGPSGHPEPSTQKGQTRAWLRA
jgi:hypothetical protein